MTFKDRIVKRSRRFRSKQKQKQKKLLRPCHKKRSNLEMTQISTFDSMFWTDRSMNNIKLTKIPVVNNLRASYHAFICNVL